MPIQDNSMLENKENQEETEHINCKLIKCPSLKNTSECDYKGFCLSHTLQDNIRNVFKQIVADCYFGVKIYNKTGIQNGTND